MMKLNDSMTMGFHHLLLSPFLRFISSEIFYVKCLFVCHVYAFVLNVTDQIQPALKRFKNSPPLSSPHLLFSCFHFSQLFICMIKQRIRHRITKKRRSQLCRWDLKKKESHLNTHYKQTQHSYNPQK